MVVKTQKEKIKVGKGDKGQALIEFILFFPFLLMMYSVTLSLANSINASINQQKQIRGYFYYRMQNNSTSPYPIRGETVSFNRFGQQVNLWGVNLVEDLPVAACFKFNIPLGEAEGDSCEDAYTDRTTQYIRVGTAYGVCGATYQNNDGHYARLPNFAGAVNPSEVVGADACLAQ